MQVHEFIFTDEETLALRDALSNEWWRQKQNLLEISAHLSKPVRRRVDVLKALLENFKEVCGKSVLHSER